MGSITSFPILCIVNLATFCRAFYEANRYWPSHKELCQRVRVNGDDILFSGDVHLIRAWSQAAKRMGLIPSVGKNFVSRRFATVNSKLFESTGETHRLIRRYHVQFRLLFCAGARSEAADRDEKRRADDLEKEIGSVERQFDLCLPAFPDSAWEEVCQIFTFHRFDSLSEKYKGVDWRRPFSMGGPGLGLRFDPLDLPLNQAWDAWANYVVPVALACPWSRSVQGVTPFPQPINDVVLTAPGGRVIDFDNSPDLTPWIESILGFDMREEAMSGQRIIWEGVRWCKGNPFASCQNVSRLECVEGKNLLPIDSD